MKINQVIFFIAILSSLFQSCNKGHHGEHSTIQQKLSEMSVDSVSYDFSSEDFLKDMNKLLADVPQMKEEFYIPQRTHEIQSFPCTSCHNVSLEALQKESHGAIKKAHWDITLIHAGQETMSCTTCHDQNNLNKLNTIEGNSLSIDHSYQLCGQCHSTQYKDWQGGAHGKRLGGWAPPRVMNTCVNCHNPHSPAFESRWPARLNTVKLKEQQSE